MPEQSIFPTIDWHAPWFQFLNGVGPQADQQIRAGVAVRDALNTAGLAPVRFIPQADLPAGVAYESHIFATGGVPTRCNLHDFFNGLVWMRFPATKRRLNALQAQAIAQSGGVQATRGPLRDALTLFDENAALLQAPKPLWQALQARDWHALCVTHRALWAQARLVLFGHALLEKLVAPYKSITAHVLCLPVPAPMPQELGVPPPAADTAAPIAQHVAQYPSRLRSGAQGAAQSARAQAPGRARQLCLACARPGQRRLSVSRTQYPAATLRRADRDHRA